jgi:type IV pilus assembly protein PilW
MLKRRWSSGRREQRGLSLVELMVGVAVGLVVVAGAALLTSTQISENRRLMIETQLQQDMRASMDIITRELRRVGTLRDGMVLQGLYSEPGARSHNRAANETTTVHATDVDNLVYCYFPAIGTNTGFGIRLTAGGVIQRGTGSNSCTSAGTYQDLTDEAVLNITDFRIRPLHSSTLRLPCPKLCDNGTPADPSDDHTDCWPNVMVREFEVTMTGRARNDANVQRTLTSRVRVRNDLIRYANPPAEVCPG